MTTDSAELQHARALVMQHGWNATAYQIINPGIDLWFACEGDAVIGYVKAPGYFVVAGAPVCPADRLSAIVAAFEHGAAQEGRSVCYFGAESRLDALLRSSPAHSHVLLGAQPSFSPQDWPGILRARASLRAQLQRARNKDVAVLEYDARRAMNDLRIRGCLVDWLSTRGLPPLHFLVEPETLERLHDRRVFVAERDGTPVGFLVASPVPMRRGWLIEQLIRGRGAPNGTAELMIGEATAAFLAAGSEYVTLGLSPLSQHAAAALRDNPAWLRGILGWMRAHGRRFYNFAGLDAFKRKFRPTSWEPVYAICNRPRFSPAALYAIACAFTAGRPFRTGVHALAQAVAREVQWEPRLWRNSGVNPAT